MMQQINLLRRVKLNVTGERNWVLGRRKPRQEFEQCRLLGSTSQKTKIPLSDGSEKTTNSLTSDCFNGNSSSDCSSDCVVGSSALAQKKTNIWFSNSLCKIKASPKKGLGVFRRIRYQKRHRSFEGSAFDEMWHKLAPKRGLFHATQRGEEGCFWVSSQSL